MAEVVALEALAWILAQDDLRPVFLGATGIAPGDLRSRIEDPETLAAVLDFLLMDDAWVAGFCGAAGLPMTRPAEARAALPGGALPDWT
jgi:hypothetical protein